MSEKVIPVGYIYILSSADNSKHYIGSTSNYNKRMSKHKSDYLCSNRYVSAFEIVKDLKYSSRILQEYQNITHKELLKREGEFIKKYNCVNKQIPGRTQKEYKADNATKMKEISFNYYKNNKDMIKKYKDDYYQKNKAIINKQMTCSCGKHYIKQQKTRHEQSKHHKAYIEKQKRKQEKINEMKNLKANVEDLTNLYKQMLAELKKKHTPKIVLKFKHSNNNTITNTIKQ
jgi:predicted GIY-YIG superfamily endonuclease